MRMRWWILALASWLALLSTPAVAGSAVSNSADLGTSSENVSGARRRRRTSSSMPTRRRKSRRRRRRRSAAPTPDPKPAPTPTDCLQKDVNYHGHDLTEERRALPKSARESVEACQKACESVPACTHFTYRVMGEIAGKSTGCGHFHGGNGCYIKRFEKNEVDADNRPFKQNHLVMKDRKVVSGPKMCKNVAKPVEPVTTSRRRRRTEEKKETTSRRRRRTEQKKEEEPKKKEKKKEEKQEDATKDDAKPRTVEAGWADMAKRGTPFPVFVEGSGFDKMKDRIVVIDGDASCGDSSARIAKIKPGPTETPGGSLDAWKALQCDGSTAGETKLACEGVNWADDDFVDTYNFKVCVCDFSKKNACNTLADFDKEPSSKSELRIEPVV